MEGRGERAPFLGNKKEKEKKKSAKSEMRIFRMRDGVVGLETFFFILVNLRTCDLTFLS